MKLFEEIKESVTNKLMVAILIIATLIMFKTCSLNNQTKELQQIKSTQDSTLVIIGKQTALINRLSGDVTEAQNDFIQLTLYKDDLAGKQKVIAKLKQKLVMKNVR